MNTQPDKKRSFLLMLIAGIAVVLFSGAGFARMLGWGWDSTGASGDLPQLTASANGGAAGTPRCPECGVIVSVRSNEIAVRMADGSISVVGDAHPARWRTGERMMVIAGTDSSQP